MGREPHGPSGSRLRITTEALDQTLGRFDTALIVEVRVRREDRHIRYADVSDNDDEGGGADHDNDFQFSPTNQEPDGTTSTAVLESKVSWWLNGTDRHSRTLDTTILRSA